MCRRRRHGRTGPGVVEVGDAAQVTEVRHPPVAEGRARAVGVTAAAVVADVLAEAGPHRYDTRHGVVQIMCTSWGLHLTTVIHAVGVVGVVGHLVEVVTPAEPREPRRLDDRRDLPRPRGPSSPRRSHSSSDEGSARAGLG
jgi:hypothetical protein